MRPTDENRNNKRCAFDVFISGGVMAQILIVDDSPTETHKMATILGKLGHDVITAENGEDGVAKAKESLPDLVLMDIVMPGLNGFQATRQLSKNASTSHIPVIIVTTKDQATDRLWGERQGAKGYLTKPIDVKALISAISDVLD
ncbi:MAG: twitching motility two-component system response regulator PilH [Oceanicoccus sp.]|jgi:twitching motility two-component system response regulator PilH